MYRNPPLVVYSCLKFLWASGSREQSFVKMKEFTKALMERLGIASFSTLKQKVETITDSDKVDMLKVVARCYLKLGEWQISLEEELNDVLFLLLTI